MEGGGGVVVQVFYKAEAGIAEEEEQSYIFRLCWTEMESTLKLEFRSLSSF